MKPALAILLVQMIALGCHVQSRPGDRLSSAGSRLRVGNNPSSVTLNDVNADGNLDLIVANQDDNNVTILLGDGKGGFGPAPRSPFSAGNSPNDIAAADVNGDGKLDLAFANHDTKYVTVLLGDGRGGFTPAPNSPFTVNSRPHPHGIAFGDFNGDRNLDFVIDDWGNDRVTVVFGDGKGNFASPGVSFAVGKMPYQRVRAADINRDGKADIVTTNTEGGDVTVLLGDGQGGFKQAAGSPYATSPRPFGLAIGDVNGDGIPDLAIAHYSGHLTQPGDDAITILLGMDNGKFKAAPGSPFKSGSAPTSVAIGDINGDGTMDVAVGNYGSNNVTVLFGGRRGLTAAPGSPFTVGEAPSSVAIGDLNGDGKGDIATANSKSNDVSILLSK